MKTFRTHGLFRLRQFATMVVLCVAIGLLGIQQRAEGWSAGPLFGLDLPYGGAHGMMAEDAVRWLDLNNLLPTNYLSARDQQLLREGASTPDSIWGPGVGFKYTWWWEGAEQLAGLIGRDIVEWDLFELEYYCIDEPCFTLKDDWENDNANLMNHEFADLSVWNPIKYWADKAKQDLIDNNRSRAMVHAGYAMHFAQDYLNPPHLGPLLWNSYQELDWDLLLELAWETTDYNYVPKAWNFNYFQLFGRCIISSGTFPISIENDLRSYRYQNALAWPTLPSLEWINEQGEVGAPLDTRIVNAVMWSEQMSQEVLQYVFDLEQPEGCISPIIIFDFVTEYYNDILDRAPEPGGAEGWTDEIERIVSLGIDINEGFIAVAKSFFNSAEYLLMAKTNAAYVTDLYETFLQRGPAQAEIDYWVGYLTQGMSRNILLYYFVYSAEFKLYMEGIFGVGAVRPENNLVNDLYRGILNRLPDTAGFNAWLGLMRAAQCQGAQQVRDLSHQIALGFIQSAEYVARGRTNSEYVGDLYDAILRRGALPAEVSAWETLLNTATREQVLQGFTNSPEFQLRVTEVINAGCL